MNQATPHNQSPAPFAPPVKSRFKAYSVGITAGAEDQKYHSKYAQLKKKVREIEADNDKLHYKILQARRSIQRMKLQRAILYERLSAPPPSPEAHDRQPLPTILAAENGPSSSMGNPDYGRGHQKTHVDTRPPPLHDGPIGPGGAPPYDMGPRSSKPAAPVANHDKRHPGHSLPPLPQYTRHPSPSPPHKRSRTNSNNMHHSPPLHHESPRSQARSSVPYQAGPSPPHPYDGAIPPIPTFQHSPPFSERDRSRHHDTGDIPRSPRPRTSESRSGELHNHQRLGPATYINRDREEWGGERDRDREWLRDEATRNPRYSSTRQSHQMRHEYSPEQHMSSGIRDERGLYHDGRPGSGNGVGGASYARLDRSETPGSGSGGSGMAADGPSRPDSREQPFYETDRRAYRLRPVGGGAPENDSRDYPPPPEHLRSHSHSRSLSRDHTAGFPLEPARASSDSRKRMHTDMDVDGEADAGDSYPGHSPHDRDRGSKRHHRDQPHRDGPEDDRMAS